MAIGGAALERVAKRCSVGSDGVCRTKVMLVMRKIALRVAILGMAFTVASARES